MGLAFTVPKPSRISPIAPIPATRNRCFSATTILPMVFTELGASLARGDDSQLVHL